MWAKEEKMQNRKWESTEKRDNPEKERQKYREGMDMWKRESGKGRGEKKADLIHGKPSIRSWLFIRVRDFKLSVFIIAFWNIKLLVDKCSILVLYLKGQ